MNSLPRKRGVRLIILFLLTSCSAALLFGLWTSSVASADKQEVLPRLVPIAPPPNAPAIPNPETQPPAGFQCRVAITTTDYNRASQNKLAPSNIGNLTKLTLIPVPEIATTQTTVINWFQLYPAQTNKTYTIDAIPTNGNNYDLGMYVYDNPASGQYLDVYTTTDPTENMATATFVAKHAGPYIIAVFQKTISCSGGTYYLQIESATPTPTPSSTATASPGPTDTPGPAETAVPGADAFEPNYDFEHAAGIGLNVKYKDINFVPLQGQTINNDFFKVRVKRGMLLTCETLDLSPGTDTNMIVYADDQVSSCKGHPTNECEALAGNDDVDTARGDLRSRVTVSINYDGYLYILVGQGFSVPDAQAKDYNYSLQCTTPGGSVSGTPAPTTPPGTPLPTRTPRPTDTPVPSATPPDTPLPPISVRPMPSPTPAGPVQQTVTADLTVSYDANGNGAADPGEGVVGLSARVYDAVTGALLAQGFTDASGRALFNVASNGPVRVIVPYLSFEATVPPSGAAIPVLISARELPSQIP